MTTTSESRESDIVLDLEYMRNRINLKQPLGIRDIKLCEDAAEEISRLRRVVAKNENVTTTAGSISDIDYYAGKVLYLLKYFNGTDKVKILHEAEEKLLLQDIAEAEGEQT